MFRIGTVYNLSCHNLLLEMLRHTDLVPFGPNSLAKVVGAAVGATPVP